MRDAVAANPGRDGELQILARDAVNQILLAQVVPIGPEIKATRMGGFRILGAYPSDAVFALRPDAVFALSAVALSPLHDEIGFGRRFDIDGCARE